MNCENFKSERRAGELTHFRNRIGESGIELIFKESIRMNGKDNDDSDVSLDITVQGKKYYISHH